MDTEFIELLKTRNDEQLLKDISLGESSFQEGYFDYFINEADARGLHYIKPVNSKIESNDFKHEIFLTNCKSNSIKIPKYKYLQVIGLVELFIMISFYFLFDNWQSMNTSQAGIFIMAYSFIMQFFLFCLLGLPVISIIKIIKMYKYVKLINLKSSNSFKINEKDVIIGMFIPFFGFIYSFILIFSLYLKYVKIHTKTDCVSLKEIIYTFMKTIVYTAFQLGLIYVLFNKITLEIEKSET